MKLGTNDHVLMTPPARCQAQVFINALLSCCSGGNLYSYNGSELGGGWGVAGRGEGTETFFLKVTVFADL